MRSDCWNQKGRVSVSVDIIRLSVSSSHSSSSFQQGSGGEGHPGVAHRAQPHLPPPLPLGCPGNCSSSGLRNLSSGPWRLPLGRSPAAQNCLCPPRAARGSSLATARLCLQPHNGSRLGQHPHSPAGHTRPRSSSSLHFTALPRVLPGSVLENHALFISVSPDAERQPLTRQLLKSIYVVGSRKIIKRQSSSTFLQDLLFFTNHRPITDNTNIRY